MMRKKIRVGACMIVLLAATVSSAGTPLIDLETGSGLVSNFKARKVGDVVTITIATENKFSGDGSTSRTGNLNAEISVTINEILPNGNFKVIGTRTVDINGDRQLIEISGICRGRDISADNAILSTYISDAQIAYSGTGMAQDSAEPGIVTRVVNWLF